MARTLPSYLLFVFYVLFVLCRSVYCANVYCTVLYYTVRYCTVLYCTVLYCTVRYCTVLYCTVLLPPGDNPIAVNKNIIPKKSEGVVITKISPQVTAAQLACLLK
jgi:hypothetical protein